MIKTKPQLVIAFALALAILSFAQTSRPAAPATRPAAPPAATSPATTSPATTAPAPTNPNPPAAGFNANESDPKAIELADLTMRAMGGREAWDEARYLTWKYFGNRRHLWDKKTGNIRFEFGDDRPGGMNIIIENVNTRTGRVLIGGEEIKDPKQLESYLKLGYNAWQNDGNAIFMPYLLKDAGATLKYGGKAKMRDGRDCEVVAMTFAESAGGMAGKKYNICISPEDHLVGQIEHFKAAGDVSPTMVTPWKNWRRFGGIMLSDTRGTQNGKVLLHTDVAVLKDVPDAVFSSLDTVVWGDLFENAVKSQ